MTKVFLFVLLVFGNPEGAWAAKIIGNGGDIVHCGDNFHSRIQLLDFYEAERLSGLKLSIPRGLTYIEKVQGLIKKISPRFPQLARRLEEDLAVFESRKKILYDVELTNVGDSFQRFLPPGCMIKQVVNQKEPMFPRHPWFIIDGRLWERADEFNRAGLVIHELLYKQGIAQGLEDSVGVRYLVGLLFSESFDRVTDHEWIQAFLASRVQRYETHALSVPLFRVNEIRPIEKQGSSELMEFKVSIEPNTMIFDSDGRLLDVYFSLGEDVFFEGPQSFIGIRTKALKLHHDWGRTEVEFSGDVTLLFTAVRSDSPRDYKASGKLDLTSGIFCGQFKPIGSSSRKLGKQPSCLKFGRVKADGLPKQVSEEPSLLPFVTQTENFASVNQSSK